MKLPIEDKQFSSEQFLIEFFYEAGDNIQIVSTVYAELSAFTRNNRQYWKKYRFLLIFVLSSFPGFQARNKRAYCDD